MLGPALLVSVVVAAVMALSTAVFVRWAAEANGRLRESIVVFLLLMMSGMFAGALLYLVRPGTTGAVAGLWLASAVMSVAVVVVFVAFLREATRPAVEDGAAPLRTGRSNEFVAAVIALVVGNEFLMGWALALATGSIAATPPLDAAGAATWAGAVVVSPWFVFTMGAEMVVTVALLRRTIPAGILTLLLAQGAIMFLSPPAFPTAASSRPVVYLGSVAMVGLFVYLMELLYRRRSFAPALAGYLDRLLAVYALMMGGLLLWTIYGSSTVFAAAIVAEMVVYFAAVLRSEPLGLPGGFAWQERPGWTSRLLAWVFVAELFMGATLAALLTPSVYTPGPQLPLTGPASTALAHALSNGFFFVTNTTASTWFLLMMGAEMGVLVLLRMREVHGRETRVRLGVMLGSYAAFAVFYPSIYLAQIAPYAPGATDVTTVPLVGWSMGLGSGAVAPAALGVIAATYAGFAVLTILFGRRAVCSVFCTAATMYQGTTLDAMKSFNRTSPTARRYLGSRWSTAYSVSAGCVMAALAGTAILSYLGATGRWTVSVAGTDPSVFLFDLSFGVVWYAMFVTVPYAGEYNCVTMGWCYTGLIAGWFSRAGFFRLRVRDPEVCRRCTTFDCARSCPVGLTDMPAAFRLRGEFRSSKCCGVGDCAEACPYGNLYLADVRHAVRPSPVPPVRARLPMAGAVRAPTDAPGAPGA